MNDNLKPKQGSDKIDESSNKALVVIYSLVDNCKYIVLDLLKSVSSDSSYKKKGKEMIGEDLYEEMPKIVKKSLTEAIKTNEKLGLLPGSSALKKVVYERIKIDLKDLIKKREEYAQKNKDTLTINAADNRETLKNMKILLEIIEQLLEEAKSKIDEFERLNVGSNIDLLTKK